MKRKKSDGGGYSFLFREIKRLKPELETDTHPITVSELDEIDQMRKAVLEVSKKPYVYCSST